MIIIQLKSTPERGASNAEELAEQGMHTAKDTVSRTEGADRALLALGGPQCGGVEARVADAATAGTTGQLALRNSRENHDNDTVVVTIYTSIHPHTYAHIHTHTHTHTQSYLIAPLELAVPLAQS